ncbi:MAG: thioesterase II family protein [Clostridium sp.]
MMEKIKLFCLPYAGGSATVYLKWRKYLSDYIEVVPVELAGRGKRFCEPLYDSIDKAIDDAYEFIVNNIDNNKFAIFGHSMGCTMTYEIYNKLVENNEQLPSAIFLSARKPPDSSDDKRYNDMSDLELVNEMKKLGGTPKEVYEDNELLKIVLKIFKADLVMLENYKFIYRPYKIKCKTLVLGGTKDKGISKNDLTNWNKFIDGKLDIKMVKGGHFYINENIEDVTDVINEYL